MFKINKIKKKEPPKITATRVILLNIPTAIFLIIMVTMKEMELSVGLTGYLCILFLSMAIMSGFMTDLQTLVDYAKDVADGKEVTSPDISDTSNEAILIINAINQIHNIWGDKDKENIFLLSDSAVLDNIPNPLIFLNNNLKIIGSNLVAHKLFGENIRNKKITAIFKDDIFAKAFEDIIDGKIHDISFDYTYTKLTPRHLYITILRLPAQAKGGATIMISINDITLQKNIEHQQIEFFANASHELKTPLSVISGLIETIQNYGKDDEQARDQFFDIIKNQTHDMTGLINDLLVISKLESNLENVETKNVNLAEIITKQQDILKIKSDPKNVSFDIDIPNDQLNLEGIENDFTQLVRNLMDNAVKYAKENTVISIQGKEVAKNQIEFTISNKTYKPVSKDDISQMTDRFFRSNDAKSRKIPGTGLGLAIVKSIVNNYNGELVIYKNDDNSDINFNINMFAKTNKSK